MVECSWWFVWKMENLLLCVNWQHCSIHWASIFGCAPSFQLVQPPTWSDCWENDGHTFIYILCKIEKKRLIFNLITVRRNQCEKTTTFNEMKLTNSTNRMANGRFFLHKICTWKNIKKLVFTWVFGLTDALHFGQFFSTSRPLTIATHRTEQFKHW